MSDKLEFRPSKETLLEALETIYPNIDWETLAVVYNDGSGEVKLADFEIVAEGRMRPEVIGGREEEDEFLADYEEALAEFDEQEQ